MTISPERMLRVNSMPDLTVRNDLQSGDLPRINKRRVTAVSERSATKASAVSDSFQQTLLQAERRGTASGAKGTDNVQDPVLTDTKPQQQLTASLVPTPTISPSGRVVIPMYWPSLPDLPLPPVRHNPSATPSYDPATGSYAPPGYESWAQVNNDIAALKARSRAMYGYFSTVRAMIEQVQGLVESANLNPQANSTPGQP